MEADDARISASISDLLFDTISYFDYREDFYHAFVCGMFTAFPGCKVESNKERGLGRPDITVIMRSLRCVLIIECKRAKSALELKEQSALALQQIERQRYAESFPAQFKVVKIGLAFCGKSCAACCA